MGEFADIDALAAFLRARGEPRIAVDGVNGAGKTTLARALVERLGRPLVSLDDFLEGNTGFVLEDLAWPAVARTVRRQRECVIEGVCLVEVLDRLALRVPALVYVKRRCGGAWADEHVCELDDEGDVDAFLAQAQVPLGFSEGAGMQRATLGIGEEIIRYHARHRPQRHATAIFWRDDD